MTSCGALARDALFIDERWVQVVCAKIPEPGSVIVRAMNEMRCDGNVVLGDVQRDAAQQRDERSAMQVHVSDVRGRRIVPMVSWGGEKRPCSGQQRASPQSQSSRASSNAATVQSQSSVLFAEEITGVFAVSRRARRLHLPTR